MHYLVEILVPRASATAIAASEMSKLKQLLTDRFGGVTEFSRAPAAGLWKEDETVIRDDIVIIEVMTESLNEAWWAASTGP